MGAPLHLGPEAYARLLMESFMSSFFDQDVEGNSNGLCYINKCIFHCVSRLATPTNSHRQPRL